MEIAFNKEELEQVEKMKSHYPSQQSALMPVLWLAQKKFGWISTELMTYIAELLHLPFSEVEGVVSFYSMYFKKPMGRYHIQVCTNISCMLHDGESIFEHISNKLGIKNMERTDDGCFSLEEVECMGACGGAPMIAINENYYENVDMNFIDDLLEKLHKN